MSCPDHATNWNGNSVQPGDAPVLRHGDSRSASVKLQPGSWKTERPARGAREEVSARARYRNREDRLGDSAGRTDGRKESGGRVGNRRRASCFMETPSGYFVAVDERDGKTLWRMPLNATIKTSPMTYAVDGEQFVALAVGSNIMCFGLND